MKASFCYAKLQSTGIALYFAASVVTAYGALSSVRPLPSAQWPGGPRGSLYDVAVSGHYAFVALGELGVGVIDISDPTAAKYVGGNSSIKNAYRLEIAGSRLYVAGRQTGFHIVDISDPLHLKRLGGVAGSDANTIAVSGSYVYAASQTNGLGVYDVSDPAHCREVGGCAVDTATVSVSGNRAYVIGATGLRIVDISDPTSCSPLGGYEEQGFSNYSTSPAVFGPYVYMPFVHSTNGGLVIIDTSDPTNCVRVGSFSIEGPFAWRVRRFDNRLYFEQHSVNLHIFDITNPTNLVRLGGISRPGLNDGVAVSGDHVFLGNFYQGLDVLNTSDPTNCTYVGQVGIYGDVSDVAASGKYALAADGQGGLRILQTGTDSQPRLVGHLGEIGTVTAVTAAGNLAYVAGRDGLRIVDVGNPTNCVLIGSCPANWTANKVALSNGYAYVASSGGLQIIDARDPATCRAARSDLVTAPATDAQILGDYLYLAGYQGLHIVDIHNPTNVTRVGGWKRSSTNLTYNALSVSWPYVYLGCGNEGFNVIHAGSPVNCVRVGGYVDASFPVNDVSLLGNYALLLNSARQEVRVFDVSNPSNSVYVTSLKTGGPTKNISVINGELFLANGLEGLVVIPAIPDVHNTLRIDATPDFPFTLEAATNLSDPNSWQPLLITNVATMPFDFVDFDVKLADKPHKFYRVRQP